MIGDIPYGEPAAEAFPAVVDRINADPDVELVAHLGDIKSGSTLCNDEYFAFVRSQFDRFADPLVYTPGDNEWTDCLDGATDADNYLKFVMQRRGRRGADRGTGAVRLLTGCCTLI